MSADRSTYPPLDVLKPVADDLWIVDSGPLTVARIELPVRMTVIRVDGGMLLHSPTRYSRELHDAIAALGPIRHLVAPSFAHWTFMREWVAACPDATTWAAPGLRERRQVRRSGLRLDRDLGDAPAWSGIEQCVIPGGGGFREVAFLHRPSGTALLTDLMQNLEPEKLPVMARPLAHLLGVAAPDGRAPLHLRALIRLRHRDAAAAVSRVLGWEPERVIFAHGRWFERDGAASLRRSFRGLVHR
jgi:hypothetical protein